MTGVPRRRRRRRRGIFRGLLCVARVLVPPPPTRYYAAPCGRCILPACNPYASGVVAALRMSSVTTTSAGGCGGGDAHESEKSLLYFSGSELSRHLHHVNAEREGSMEVLLVIL